MIPLHNHSHYSLLKSTFSPTDLVKHAKKLGYTSCALTDYGSISGVPEFLKAAKKEKIKPIVGVDLNVDGGNCILIAKNKNGWKKLLKIITWANEPGHFHGRPTITSARLQKELGEQIGEDLICITGFLGSEVANCILKDVVKAYEANTYEDVKNIVNEKWVEQCSNIINNIRAMFGPNNIFLSSSNLNKNIPAEKLVCDGVRYLGSKLNIPCVATNNCHYLKKDIEAVDHKLLLCIEMQTTFKNVEEEVKKYKDREIQLFFLDGCFHLPSPREFEENFKPEEISNSDKVGELCEPFDIFGEPRLPKFPCPDGVSSDDYFTQLCREGWKKRIQNTIPLQDQCIYSDRVKMELDVLKRAGLSDQFLITWDFIKFLREQGDLVGAGRGSAAGCLVSYLLEIVQIDAIKYKLIFSRFYNEGRNTKDHRSLADIDVDVPVKARHKVVEYLVNKYGRNRTGQCQTFGRLMGKGILREVLRIHEACGHSQITSITENFEEEAKLAAHLQEMADNGEKESIIVWSLRHQASDFKQWCELDKEGNYTGEYAQYFAQAARLEGVLKSTGTHAAAVVISADDMVENCPFVNAKNSEFPLVGFEYEYVEAIGIPKFDVLGLAALDKLQMIQRLVSKNA